MEVSMANKYSRLFKEYILILSIGPNTGYVVGTERQKFFLATYRRFMVAMKIYPAIKIKAF